MKTDNPFSKVKFTLIMLCFAAMFASSSCSSDDDVTEPLSQDKIKDDDFYSSVFVLETKDLIPVATPVIDAKDNVYMIFIHDLMLHAKSTIICIDADNKSKWEILINEPITSLVLTDNKVIATAYEKLYAISTSDGKIDWTYQLTKTNTVTNTKTNHKPCIDNNGNIIVAIDSYLEEVLKIEAIPARVISLTSGGNLNWELVLSTGDSYNDRYSKLCNPVFASDKTYITWYYSNENDNFDVIAINSSGEIANSKSIGDFYNGRILCANRLGDLYVYADIDMAGGKIHLLSNDLTPKWSLPLAEGLSIGNVLLDESSNIYFNSEDGKMYKFDKDGNKTWDFEYGKIFVRGDLILGEDGDIYKMGQGLAKINPNSGQDESITFEAGYGAGELSMRNNGEIVVPTMLDKVYFVKTESKGLNKKAQWAKAGKDYSNSSSIN
jgi:hypothetical protein